MFTLLKARAIPLQQKIINACLKSIIPAKLHPGLSLQNFQGTRTLFSKYSLGMEGFLQQGVEFRSDIANYKESFVKKMQSLAHSTDKGQIIYTEDLRKLIALCQEEKEHLDLIINLVKKYYQQTRGVSLQPFRFGPPVIRLLYMHELTGNIFEILRDEDLVDHFVEDALYQVAMDLLYKKECYEDTLKLMKTMKSIPKSCVTLALAASYKISTDKALETALDLNRKIGESEQRPTLRMIAFMAALALKRGKPEIALEVCANCKFQKHYLINNLRMLAKAHLGELDEVMRILEISASIDSSKMTKFVAKPVFASDVIEEIEKIVNDKLQLELISKFVYLKKTLQDMNLISSQVLEESVCAPIRDNVAKGKQRRRRRDDFRPGLSSQQDYSAEMEDSTEEHLDRF